jgi:hypothetical protein
MDLLVRCNVSAADFIEDNGALAGTPGKGTTRTFRRTEVNWKGIDDSTTAYSSSSVTTGLNSYIKYQALAITGTYNQLSAGKFGHTTGIFGAGLKLLLLVTSGYSTPTATLCSTGVDATSCSGLADASQTVWFSPIGPEAAGQTGTFSIASGYTQYLVSQLVTNTLASAGDTATATLSIQYTEN